MEQVRKLKERRERHRQIRDRLKSGNMVGDSADRRVSATVDVVKECHLLPGGAVLENERELQRIATHAGVYM